MPARLTPARRILDQQVQEGDLQRALVTAAEALGWRWMHIRDSRKQAATGWPDLTLCRPPRLLLVELKREGRYPTAKQREWLAALGACPGVEVFSWRPRDWSSGEVERVLRGEG